MEKAPMTTPDLSKEFHPVPKPGKKEKNAPKPIKQIGKKATEWTKDRAKLIKEAVIEGIIEIKDGVPTGTCLDCRHYHPLNPDHVLKRSQGGSNGKSNIDWVCNIPPCLCHDKRDNQGDPRGKKKRMNS